MSWKLQIIQCRNAVHELRSYIFAEVLLDFHLLPYKGLMPECKNPNSLITFNICHHVDIFTMHLHRPSNQQLLLFLLLTSDLVFFTNNLHMLFEADLCIWLQRELLFVKSYRKNASFIVFVIRHVLWKLNTRVSNLYEISSQQLLLHVTWIGVALVSVLFRWGLLWWSTWHCTECFLLSG